MRSVLVMKVILNFAVVVGVDVVAEGVFGIPHTWDSSIVWPGSDRLCRKHSFKPVKAF
jgi:hypothetical protein